jgi:hypothetical protein
LGSALDRATMTGKATAVAAARIDRRAHNRCIKKWLPGLRAEGRRVGERVLSNHVAIRKESDENRRISLRHTATIHTLSRDQ